MAQASTRTPGATADPVEIARALIRHASVTPEDAGAQATLESVLAPHGFDCHHVRFSEDGTPDVDNFYARLGSGPPVLIFAGHTDVVPPGDPDAWTHPPFAAEIADGMLFGRGAVDMKGGIAAFAAAVIDHLAEAGPPAGSIVFLITGDEEGPAINGTRKLLEWAHARGERFDAAIVGEPSNREVMGDVIRIGRRGSLSATLTVTGRQGHVAYGESFDNPLPGLLAILNALTAKPLDEGTEHFQPSNIEVTTIDVGNPAFNVVPERAMAKFNIRHNDLHSAESLSAWVRETMAAAIPPGLAADVDFEPSVSPVFVTRDETLIRLMADSVEAETGRRPETNTFGGTSDARFIKDYCPVIEFGLVSTTIHQVNERTPIDDLHTLTRIYRAFLSRYFSAR